MVCFGKYFFEKLVGVVDVFWNSFIGKGNEFWGFRFSILRDGLIMLGFLLNNEE